MSRASRFSVTIATQRSGTKLLGDCLNQGHGVLSVGEIFHDHAPTMLSFRTFLARQPALAEWIGVGRSFELLDAYFNELISISPYVHFDVMYNNLHYFAPLWWEDFDELPLLHYFKSREFAIIHLLRDPADCYISTAVALETQRFHSTAVLAPLSDAELTRTLEHHHARQPFAAFLRTLLTGRAAVDRSIKQYPWSCVVRYEEMLSDDGFLPRGLRQKLSLLMTGMDCPEALQHAPCRLHRPHGPESRRSLRAVLERLNPGSPDASVRPT